MSASSSWWLHSALDNPCFFGMKGEQPCALRWLCCCLALNASYWQRCHSGNESKGKRVFFCPLLMKQDGCHLSQRDIWSSWCASSVGSAVCERGTVTQLWQPSGTSDGWHARMGHAAFWVGCVDRLSSRISHSASVGLIAGRAGHRRDTWISLL